MSGKTTSVSLIPTMYTHPAPIRTIEWLWDDERLVLSALSELRHAPAAPPITESDIPSTQASSGLVYLVQSPVSSDSGSGSPTPPLPQHADGLGDYETEMREEQEEKTADILSSLRSAAICGDETDEEEEEAMQEKSGDGGPLLERLRGPVTPKVKAGLRRKGKVVDAPAADEDLPTASGPPVTLAVPSIRLPTLGLMVMVAYAESQETATAPGNYVPFPILHKDAAKYESGKFWDVREKYGEGKGKEKGEIKDKLENERKFEAKALTAAETGKSCG